MGAHGFDDDGGGGIDRGYDLKGMFWRILPGILGAVAALLITVPLLYLDYQSSEDDGKFPEYTVAVAGFSGLDPDLDLAHATLDPTFDLAVRITEPRKRSVECVERGTTASVSYRGVPLARGPVPGFCGRNEDAAEVNSVMAWGSAVPVPRFARERLAEELRRGEAAVDVTLTAPARFCYYCHQKVVDCRAGVGRGEASPRCRVSFQVPTLPDGPDKRPPARRLLRPSQWLTWLNY